MKKFCITIAYLFWLLVPALNIMAIDCPSIAEIKSTQLTSYDTYKNDFYFNGYINFNGAPWIVSVGLYASPNDINKAASLLISKTNKPYTEYQDGKSACVYYLSYVWQKGIMASPYENPQHLFFFNKWFKSK